jgi:cysteine desulfurase
MQIYLDHNATTPVRPEAIEVMQRALVHCYGNPSSSHAAGAEARAAVERARGQVAELMGAEPDAVVFTSSATEANNAVLRSAARRAPQHGDRVVTCATEHPSVLEVCEELREQGLRVTLLEVGRDGRLDPAAFERSLDARTLLATVMWVNNETGVIQPIPELARIARARGVPFHTDAVQALGKLELGLGQLPVDSASFSAHKLGGPKGIGALYLAPGARFTPLLRGGPQERRRRAGTENVLGIAGFGAACAAARADLAERAERLGKLRDRLWRGIEASIPDVSRNGAPEHCVSHTLNVAFAGALGEAAVAALDLEGIAAASGAACHSGSIEPSHVLLAMGIPPERAASSIRFSLGFDTTPEDIERVIGVLPKLVERVRAEGAP